jgi:hypothetical protein
MRYLSCFFLIFFFVGFAHAQAPPNDEIKDAINLTELVGYCSAEAAYQNTGATTSGFAKGIFWQTAGKDIWYTFTALHTDIVMSLTGKAAGNNNTLINPLIAFYTFENNILSEQIGSMTTANNLTTAYKGGLVIGNVYYVRISAEQDEMGTFQLCINNYNPPKRAGQDCSTATYLCSKAAFTELNVTGAGNDNHESSGTCLSVESNTAWYKFTASKSGTLTFTITPTRTTDDIDWVLYDLDNNEDCSNISSLTAIRCAAGSGINCTPKYHITGLSLTSTDFTESSGCGDTKDGMVRYIDMIAGHTYALMIDNFSNGNNGFTISFDGTGEFVGPKSEIKFIANDCPIGETFTFYTDQFVGNTASLWDFGEGASPRTASAIGPHLVKYSSPGFKTVSLTSTGTKDCQEIGTERIYVGSALAPPIISFNKTHFCL